jgi:hypothetical protein
MGAAIVKLQAADGHLDSAKEHPGAAGADVTGGEGLNNPAKGDLGASGVELIGYFDGGFPGMDRPDRAGVEVAEPIAAHGGRLAMEPTGHYVTTFGDHEVLSSAYPLPPPPTRVFGRNGVVSMGWRQGSTVRYIVFNNMEAKFLKTENLG